MWHWHVGEAARSVWMEPRDQGEEGEKAVFGEGT